MKKFLAATALATTGALGVVDAEARSDVDVQWSVTIGSPFYAPPVYVPRVIVPPLFVPSAPVYWRGGHHSPRHWDRDRDGVPNRYDHRYNPRWDRDGDGVPNRYDRHPYGRHGWHGRHDGRGWHDGRGGHDHRGRDHWGGGRRH